MAQRTAPIVLDCTLRDGGYYNAWDFKRDLVRKYFRSLAAASVDVVEVGFRMLPQEKFLGPFAYCTDEFIAGLNIPDSIDVAVMVDAKDLLADTDSPAKAVSFLFKDASQSRVDVVRVAVHVSQIAKAQAICDQLRALGYQVCVNIMQVSERTEAEVIESARQVASWNLVNTLYFADSLGNLDAQGVRRVINWYRQSWDGDIGVHAHDNCRGALSNTLVAFEEGVTWLDSTVLGMGRGAGNTQTEYLLLELEKRGFSRYRAEALYLLVLEDFANLWRTYSWGPNLLYYLAAHYGIHPTYIQEMLSSKSYDLPEILAGIETLQHSRSSTYSAAGLRDAMRSYEGGSGGSWNPAATVNGREVLVVAAGPSVPQHLDGIVQYIRSHKPFVICLNTKIQLPPDCIDAFAMAHQLRIALAADTFRELGKPLICPWETVNPEIRARFGPIEIHNYGMSVEEDRFEAAATTCIVPAPYVAPYALAVAVAAGAKRILMAGFDGFADGDPRHEEIEQVFAAYHRSNPAVPLISLTPTTYTTLKQSSVYAPQAGRAIDEKAGVQS